MGGSGGVFGQPKQKASGAFKMTSEAREAERQAILGLNRIATGRKPSIGQQQMAMNMDMANRQALALAASSRGASNPMLAFRQAQLANQQMGLEGAQQASIMGQQERMQAQQMLLGQAAAQRGVALNSATANQQTDANTRGQTLNMVSGLGGAAMLASDERVKEDIKPMSNIGKEIAEFVKHIKPSEYEYSDPKHGTGKKVGVMAQDLEKSKIGQTMVDQAPDGTKMVDTNKAIGALLAAAAEMHKKIDKLENKKA
jgi:hypothetical protein